MPCRIANYLLGSLILFSAVTICAFAADPPAMSPRTIGKESAAQAESRKVGRSKMDIPKADPVSVAPPPAGALSIDGLKTMLENMGYEPKVSSYTDGSQFISLPYSREGWTLYFSIDLSPDKSQFWMSVFLAEVQDPAKVSGEAVLKLLEAEALVWPAYFQYYTGSKNLYIYRPLKNQDLKPVLLKSTLEAFANNIYSTVSVWDTSKWTAGSAPTPPPAK